MTLQFNIIIIAEEVEPPAEFLLTLLLVAVAPFAVSGSGQERAPSEPQVSAFIGKTVRSAELVVDGEVSTDDTLLGFIETRPGRPLSMLDVRETIAHLYSLGRSQDIQVDAEAAPDGVIVRFRVNRVRKRPLRRSAA